MTSPTTFPGVYIREIPSGVRPITGVATSITAFIGPTVSGPTNKATTVNGFGDFQRIFGGLSRTSPLSFAVNGFFLNGGSQAVIVRVAGLGATAATITVGTLNLQANGPGAWGQKLRVSAEKRDLADVDAALATSLGAQPGDLFDLVVQYLDDPADPGSPEIAREVFRNLTLVPSARQVTNVLREQSELVRVDPTNPLPTTPPANGDTGSGTGGADGAAPGPDAYTGDGLEARHEGLFALDNTDLFNLLCIPPPSLGEVDTPAALYRAALAYCVKKRAMLIVDPPSGMAKDDGPATLAALALTGTDARNAALYFPRVRQPDPTSQNRLATFVPCGVVAGVIARTDATRGVWKAPAGIDAALAGVDELVPNPAAAEQQQLTDPENGTLNVLGINCLRTFPVFGRVVWGARTLRGADTLADEYKYLPVRRLALFLEESLYRGTQWVVFEPNDEPLWAQIRLNIGAFMQGLFRQGAFEGTSPRDAYFVKCDAETTTVNDRNLGRVNVIVGFAPLRPAEFVILQIQQIARAQA
jgi:phage tail sheath protein FI